MNCNYINLCKNRNTLACNNCTRNYQIEDKFVQDDFKSNLKRIFIIKNVDNKIR